MAQKTDLNVAPYYDDYDASQNYIRTLFRPGFAIQARELTQLQSGLQNQISRFGEHMFKEGSVVIPGQVSVFPDYHSLKLASTFATETIDPEQYYNATTPVIITGVTSGVTAEVVGFVAATTSDQPTLFLRYIKSGGGTSNAPRTFQDGENITANKGITHTTSYSTGVASATTYTSVYSTAAGSTDAQLRSSTGPAAAQGVAVKVEAGVYFVRGHFVECSEETVVVSKYDPSTQFRAGFKVTETLLTPENESSLLDNATGSTNFAAKGAHRLKFTLELMSMDYDAITDSDFIELASYKNDRIQTLTRNTEYNILEETLARRTFDESGNYTVRPFQLIMKESNTLNELTGVYKDGDTTDDNQVSSNALLACQISTGKAYVRGYEIEKLAPTFKDINKARDVENINAGVTTFELGNYATVNNVYGTPDITFNSGESSIFGTVTLYPHFISTNGSTPVAGQQDVAPIGQARVRAMEYDSGTIGTADARYKVYLFDVKMFTYITLSGTPSPTLIANHANGGVKITGVTSGATGYVVNNIATTSGTQLVVIKTSGRFSNGEKFTASDSEETSSIVENSSNTDLTMISSNGTNADNTHTFEQVRSMVFVDSDSGQNFTADVVQEPPQNRENLISSLRLDGTDAGGANANNTFTQDEGDDDPSGGIILERQLFPRLRDPEKNNLLEKLPKQVVKTLLTENNQGATDTQYTVRRQFIGTTNASGIVTFNASTNESFVTHAEKDYVMSILTAGGGTGSQGQLVSIADTVSGTGTASLTITDNTILGSSAKVKLIATILKTSVTQKNKTTKLMKQMKVVPGATDAYGTRPGDRDISLGRADAFKLVGVFDSQDTSTDAAAPTLTLSGISGTFTRGEKITGGTSGATGRIIDTSSPMSFVSTNSFSFTAETITGESSGATATVTGTTDGDIVITSKYLLDTGQRDNYYDTSRITRKRGQAAPIGRLLVVYDYLEHGAGDVFTVDSYSDVAKQMEYDDIPIYTGSKIDVDEPEPSGKFPLYDTYDFRPRVDDVAGASATLTAVDEITGNSFNFYDRGFQGTGGSLVDVPKPGSFVQSDFEYYLPKFASLILNSNGNFVVVEGESAENPLLPKVPEDSMLIATMFIPAYTFLPRNVTIRKVKHQRYTMKDIGKIDRRLDHVEYYTALTLLERDAESFEVTDANGLNRFKSGFVVDNFKGHRVGDTVHRDYKNAMDYELGHLRPQHRSIAIDLKESVTTDAERTAAGYQKTGDLITLPYTEETLTEQPYATRVEKITPLISSQWTGIIELSPSSDTWFETDILPVLVVNEEGDYDAVLARERNNLGTVWNAWQTQWSGVVETRTENFTEGGTQFTPDRFDVTRTIETVRTDQTRTGVNTQVSVRIDRESQGLRVVSRTAIPIVRSRTITFTGERFRPNSRLHGFFDKVAINAYITPANSTYTTVATPVAGSPLVTSATGKIEGTFTIPDPKVDGNPQFNTGEIEFRLSSSAINGIVTREARPGTAGSTIYSANGLLETQQETIIATRNATVTRTGTEQSTSFNNTRSNDVRTFAGNFNEEQEAARRAQQANDDDDDDGGQGDRWWARAGGIGGGAASGGAPGDPLAQTFLVQNDGTNTGTGVFVTSVDVYHQAKDDVIPVTLELRNVVNGFPGPKLLPFGRVTKNPADINISETAATATTYTFPSPVYVETDTEYAIVLLTNTNTHKVWISRMGETDIAGVRTVSDQPHVGVLYKSANNTGWSPSPMEDLKFSVKTAKFSTTAGVLALTNDEVPLASLAKDPLIITDASTVMKVHHPDHNMYATTNNVTISGVKSPATTTLNGGISATQTTLTLTSGTNFDDTSGIYSKLANGLWYIKIDDEIMTYNTISTNAVSGLTRGVDGTTAAEHASGATVELYQAHKVPFTEINKTHTAVANTEIDSYTLTLSTTPVVDGNGSLSSVGGSEVKATENAIMDVFSTQIGLMELPGTSLNATALVTRATSPSGSQTSFENTRDDELVPTIKYPLNDNYKFEVPYMVCSTINETNELSSQRSFETRITMATENDRISPVIDLGRMSMIAVANRINNIDSSSDVYPTSDYVGSERAEGDENAAIYLTKQVTLANLATGLKVLFAAHRPSSNDLKVMYKILPIDESEDFDNLGYTYFNTDGSPDVTVPPSSSLNDFQEYEYSAGVTDDGIGDPLQEFISFQIKIIMQGTNCAEPPRLKGFRCLALGT